MLGGLVKKPSKNLKIKGEDCTHRVKLLVCIDVQNKLKMRDCLSGWKYVSMEDIYII